MKALIWTIVILAALGLIFWLVNRNRNGKTTTTQINPDGTKTVTTRFPDGSTNVATYNTNGQVMNVRRNSNTTSWVVTGGPGGSGARSVVIYPTR